MKTHFSASELAGLPGLPTTARRVLERAKREIWPSRHRHGNGGGREYPITCLPAVTQAALAEKVLSAAPAASSSSFAAAAHFSSTRGEVAAGDPTLAAPGSTPGPRSESLAAAFDAKPESLKADARERLAIVQEYAQLLGRGFKRDAVIAAVTKERSVSAATLSRYLGLVKGKPQHEWLFGLCPRYAGRTARADMSAEAWEFLKAEYLSQERRSAAACIDRLRRAARGRDWIIPRDRTLRRRLAGIDRMVRVIAREGRKAAMQLYPAQARVRAALQALSIINGDGYKHNLWVVDGQGETFRAKTWFWQDVYSSKILAWRTDRTEHTGQIQLSFGDVCERHGIPDAVLLDNTLAAANKTMSGGIRHRFRFKVREDEPLGVFALFNVRVHWATPGHGQAKPIERVFGIGGIGEYVDKAPEFKGAWAGSSTQDKPEYDGSTKAVPIEQLHQVIAREVEAWNVREGRRGAIAKGRSFEAVFAESYASVTVRKPSEAQRRLWLLSTQEVPVARDGTIVLDAGRMVGERRANRYWNAELGELHGKKVSARFDPQRLHEGVHVYTADGRYVCFANCINPAAFNDQDAAREHSRNRRQFIKGARLQLDATVRMDTLTTARLLPGKGAATAAEATIATPKVLRGEFRDPLERPRIESQPLSADAQAFMDQIEAEGTAPEVNVYALTSDPKRHEYWKVIDARRAAGETLSERDEDFWKAWQQGSYYRIQTELDAQEVVARRA
jgi:Mu transposase/Mu DNA binding protein/Mu DNA-binding protein/Mu transposase-like protein